MLKRFLRGQDGAAAIEFGLVAPILAVVLIGVAIYGGLVLAYNKMSQGVSSGAQYAMTAGGDDTTAIRSVVLAAWDDRPGAAVVTVAKACLCAGLAHSCSTSCDDGDYPLKVTTINASMSYADITGTNHAISTMQKVRTW